MAVFRWNFIKRNSNSKMEVSKADDSQDPDYDVYYIVQINALSVKDFMMNHTLQYVL